MTQQKLDVFLPTSSLSQSISNKNKSRAIILYYANCPLSRVFNFFYSLFLRTLFSFFLSFLTNVLVSFPFIFLSLFFLSILLSTNIPNVTIRQRMYNNTNRKQKQNAPTEVNKDTITRYTINNKRNKTTTQQMFMKKQSHKVQSLSSSED